MGWVVCEDVIIYQLNSSYELFSTFRKNFFQVFSTGVVCLELSYEYKLRLELKQTVLNFSLAHNFS